MTYTFMWISVSHWNPFSLPLYQQTPLHIAAGEGYKITSELLADGGAKLNMKNKTGVRIIMLDYYCWFPGTCEGARRCFRCFFSEWLSATFGELQHPVAAHLTSVVIAALGAEESFEMLSGLLPQ